MRGEWIWCAGSDPDACDEYAAFSVRFDHDGVQTPILRLSCDSIFTASLNGEVVGFSGCCDYPDFKYYDEIPLTGASDGENELLITVWHLGNTDSSVYVAACAGVRFEITARERLLAESGPDTPSRRMNEYKNGYRKIISGQLGYSWFYDATVTPSGFAPSVPVRKTNVLRKRPQKLLRMEERAPMTLLAHRGSILIDLSRETAGFLELDFDSPSEQTVTVAYGEHILDGGVRRKIGPRDFSVEYRAKKGSNHYLNTLRRLAGRYLEVFSEEPLTVRYIGLRPVIYPVTVKKRTFADPLDQRIYDTAVHGLVCCMHEHYEDCPWREQALYALDSRIQMLCGYYAFESTEFQRSNLVLIGHSARPDGFLTICAPAGLDLPIPFFSLAYVLAVCEYVEHTGDALLLDEVGDTVKGILNGFASRRAENGLIPVFPAPFWNFYEWSLGSSGDGEIADAGKTGERPLHFDLILNAAFVFVSERYGRLAGRLTGRLPEGYPDPAEMKKSIFNMFFDKEKHIFHLHDTGDLSSQLGNAMAILIGLGGRELAMKTIDGEGLVPISLFLCSLFYDALMSLRDPEIDAFILSDVRRRYRRMLDAGATTFWETEIGADDFGLAGSLCHGCTSVPVYVFAKLLGGEDSGEVPGNKVAGKP